MPPRDEFDDPEGFFSRLITVSGSGRASIFENRSLLVSAIVFVVVVALSGVIWASYPSQNPLASDGSVPIIRADAEPYKYVPSDRGGMAIPHRDSTVFDAMREGSPDGKVENLLADNDEAPVDRQELFAGLKTDLAQATGLDEKETGDGHVQIARMGDYTQQRPMTETERRNEAARRNREMLEQEAEPLPGEPGGSAKRAAGVLGTGEVEPDLVPKNMKGAPSELPPEDEAAENAEAEKATKAAEKRAAEEKAVAEKSAAKPEDKKTTKPAETATKESKPTDAPKVQTGTGNAFVQVASVPDAGRVPGEWAVVSGKLPMIAGMPYRVQKADIAGKGTYHRIQVGPMSKDDAVKLCDSIKAQKPGGCLVVK